MRRFNILGYNAGRIRKIRKGKYFYSVLLAMGFCLAATVILFFTSAPSLTQLEEGDISLGTVYAPYDFTYPTVIDEGETERVRKDFEAQVSPVYDIDASVETRALARVDNFFDKLKEVRQNSSLGEKEKIEAVKVIRPDITLADKDLIKLLGLEDADKTRKDVKAALGNIFLAGIIGSAEKAELLAKGMTNISVKNIEEKTEERLKVKDIADDKEVKRIVQDELEKSISQDKAARNAVYTLIEIDVSPNLRLNAEETSKRKKESSSQVPPVYKRKTVKKNELIVEKGKKLTKDDIVKLNQITNIHFIVNRAAYLSGLVMLLLGLILGCALYLLLLEKKLIQNPKNTLVICINSGIAILVSLLIVQYHQPPYLIPLASIAMVLTLLLNPNAAFITTFALSIYIGFIAGGKIGVSFALFMGSIVGIYMVRGARRRSQIFIAGFAVSLVNFFSIVGISLLNNMEKEVILRESLYGVVNGIASSFIAIGLLPIFEYIFDYVTNITLLELSDLSNPLLKELTIKAPGTYHHSILVGNLAEEACDSIGANSLLARVGAYYHDIGKMEKAEYFVENEMGMTSKHKRLAPSMSALIITNHTKDGTELARKHKLNGVIMDFISQHHGTGLIYYFYQRALEKVKSDDTLKEEEFRYPGPKPQTKEVAIVLLADSVEASSRMLNDPTPARIRGLVQKIINNKFIDGQLDECDLTLSDLNKIAESFVRILTGVFHTRLEYPEGKPVKE